MLLTLALFMMARSGFRRGMELMPWPDGLEYAAAAVNLDRGLGPVLHFGGYSYPSRYTEGYPLILAAAYPILGRRVELLCLATVVMGLVAIVALYILTFRMFGRPSAFAACVLLALSPVFITYSTLVLSDVPTMTVTILAALALLSCERGRGCASPSLIVDGSGGAMRPARGIHRDDSPYQRDDADWHRHRDVHGSFAPALLVELLPVAIAFGVAFAIFPIWQAWTNYRYLGGLTNSGYVFWVPEVYGSFAKTFNPRFLFGATMPGNPYGNVLSYVLTLTGLDGMLGDPGDPRYLMYPFAAAVFADHRNRHRVEVAVANRSARDVVWAGVSRGRWSRFTFSTSSPRSRSSSPRRSFYLPPPATGSSRQHRAMLEAYGRARKTSRDNAVIAGVVALDLMLAISMVAETAGRVTATPPQSKMVPTLLAIRPQLQPDAIVISNISLQFLELYLATPKTELIGLNAFDPGGQFTDYHLARLYVKKAAGWSGSVPPVLFGGSQLPVPARRFWPIRGTLSPSPS